MTRQGCNGGARGAVAAPLRHCEARSAVAIQVFMQPPMNCFVPRNDEAGVHWRPLRHCEARSAVAIDGSAHGLLGMRQGSMARTMGLTRRGTLSVS